MRFCYIGLLSAIVLFAAACDALQLAAEAPPQNPNLHYPFTSAFKKLNPIPQFKATAKLGEFLEARFSQSF